jgi:hypothetical protein
MTQLHPSPTCPGHWRLGERELAHGDVIEVLILGKWYTAAICHDLGLREYRLLIDGLTHSLPLTEGLPARWPQPDRLTGDPAEQPNPTSRAYTRHRGSADSTPRV